MAAKKKTKKTKVKYLKPIIILLMIGIAVFYFLQNRKDYVKVFDTRIPKSYKVCGIDVSRYQSKIDWRSVSQARGGKDSLKISFAFIKATEGQSLKDPRFKYNWEKSKENNILRGAYHYYKPNVNSKLQADNFIATVKLEKGDLPPVLDIEETGKFGNDNMRQGIKNWLTIVEKHYGVKPIVYCYVDFYERYLLNNDFKDYPLWIAHYYKDKLRVKEKWHFWQYSDKGSIDGIRAPVDFNVFNGSVEKLNTLRK